MAMAAIGKSRHYRRAEIRLRHWLTTAARMGLEATAREDVGALAARASQVVHEVAAMLPAGFPALVVEPIFAGLESASRSIIGELD